MLYTFECTVSRKTPFIDFFCKIAGFMGTKKNHCTCKKKNNNKTGWKLPDKI